MLLIIELGVLEILGFISAFIVGISLGLLGSGGSILSMPIFIYLFKLNEKVATAYSLFVVGASALFASYRYGSKKLINYRVALFFGIPSIISVIVVRYYLIPIIPEIIITINDFHITRRMLILGLFSILLILAGYQMLKKNKHIKKRIKKNFNYPLTLLEGFTVGGLTGLVGAGGGFLIVPSLVILSDLKLSVAIGTSLMIISVKSLLGFFIGDVMKISIDWEFLGAFSTIALIGVLIGITLSQHVKTNLLKKGYGLFIGGIGILILIFEFML